MDRRKNLMLMGMAVPALVLVGTLAFGSEDVPDDAFGPEAAGTDAPAGRTGFAEDEMRGAATFGDGAPALQVPLESTTERREAFAEDLGRALSGRGPDLRRTYEEWIDEIGANGVIDVLRSRYPRCHDEGHDLGKVIYARTGDIGTALRTCQDACYSGCMHGVLMEVFAGAGARPGEHVTLDGMKERIVTVCADRTMADMYKKGDCLHGIGHALMFLADYRIATAIGSCDLLPTHPERYYCATGAYMEYVAVRGDRDAGTKGRFYPCDRVPYPAACFRYKLGNVFQRLYDLGTESPLAVVDECERLESTYRVGCFHGIGNAHMGYVAAGQIALKDLCGRGTKDDQYACIEGVMERLGKFQPEAVDTACGGAYGWHKSLCEASAARAMYDLDKPFDLYRR